MPDNNGNGEFVRTLKTALTTIIVAVLMGWGGWLTMRVIENCEKIAVIQHAMTTLSASDQEANDKIKVLFRRLRANHGEIGNADTDE